MEKILKKVMRNVNRTLGYYKKGGWIDVRRTPTSPQNMVESLEEFVEARFNRECWDIPELKEALESLDGFLFKCTLEEPNELDKKFKEATMELVNLGDIEDPTEELGIMLEAVEKFLGGTKIKFNSVKTKVIYEII